VERSRRWQVQARSRRRTATPISSTARGELVSFYFAEIDKPAHLFVIGVDTYNKHDFDALTPVASKLLARLRLPSKLPPNHS
jgi:hypothetical protein